MKENVKRILNDKQAQSLRDVDVKSLQKAFQTSWQALQNWKQSDHVNANRSHRFDELFVSSQNAHDRFLDLFVWLI